MKKLFALLAVVLAVVSCQKDADLGVNVGGEQLVNITVALPEATRATSGVGALDNGVLANYDLRYILEIYRVEGTEIQYDSCQRFVKPTDETTVVFPVRLVAGEGRNYKIVAWADIVETGSEDDRYYYTQDGLDNVVLMDNGTVNWNAMDETRDAYTAEKLINNFNSASDLNLTLTRPFAKVRVIATDIDDVLNVGIEPTTAEANYLEHMPHKFNAVADNGVALNEKPALGHSYTYGETATEYTDNTGEMTLFADYVFVPQSGTAKFSLEVFDAQGRSIKNNAFNTEIFVERNKVTTIKGDVLTTGGNVIVKVEDEFDGEIEIKVVDTPEALVEQFESLNDDNVEEVNIEFGGDINLNDLLTAGILSTRAGEAYGLKVPAGKTVVLDLNGHTLSQEKECSAHYSMIDNYGNLTITGNGTISFKDTGAGDPNFGWGSYTISNRAGTLVVENGTIEHIGEQNQGNGTPNCHMYCAIWQYDGSTIINGGKISTPTYRSARLWQGDMTINGGEFDGQLWLQAINNNANLTINGGTFSPNGNDGSSVFVSNSGRSVVTAIKGGHYEAKIGASEPFACITGGTFTEEAKNGTNAALLANGYFFEKVGENYVVNRTSEAKVGSIIDINGVKAVIFSLENGMKAVSVEQGGEMTWDESMDWAKNLGEGWNLSTISELQAIYAVRKTLNEALAADNAENALFEEDEKEEDGTYAAYWSSTLVEGSTTKAHYFYFDHKGRVTQSFTMFPVEYSRAVYNLGYYNVGDIVEAAGQKGVVFSIENGVKAVSVEELNLNLQGKYWQDAIDWAADLGEGWSLASMEDLNAIYDLRCELNDVLEADNAENALFWEGDVYYQKNGQNFYAAYLSCNEAPAGEVAPNGETYFANRVFIKIFNLLGYQVAPYSTFDCINKYAPLRDNHFARGVISL